MSVQKWTVKEAYLSIPCALGEGPWYEEHSNTLRFVDIAGTKLHSIDLAKGPDSLRTVDTGTDIGVTADFEGAEEGKIIALDKYGYSIFDTKSGKHEYLRKVWEEQHDAEKEPRMRMNDGAVDSKGRFWGGAMNDPKVKSDFEAEGVLFRLDPDLKLHRMVENATVPNGIGWNYKDDTMYWTDSTTSKIAQFDYNPSTGSISNRRTFFEYVGDGVPDGFIMDVEGCLWSAVYGGSKVIRISPEGKLIGEVSLPTRCITCPAFVGTSLFITSAKESQPEKFPESAKYAGNLFKVDVGVKGKPKHKFRIDSVASG